MILFADREGPDQTARMRRLIWAFVVRVCPKTCFHMAWLKCARINICNCIKYMYMLIRYVSIYYLLKIFFFILICSQVLLYCYEYDGKRYLVTKMYRLRLARISMWLNQDLGAGLGGSVGCAIRLETRRSRVQPQPRSATFFRGDWSWNIFYGHSLPSADSRRAVVSFWRKNVHITG